MQTVLIVIHLMITIALVAVVLLQRSEGGALGVGGGGGFMTGRGQANVLTRATSILAALFFVTSLSLTLLATYGQGNKSILEGLPGPSEPAPKALPKEQGSVLDQLRQLEKKGSPGATPSAAGPTPAQPSAGPGAPPMTDPASPAATRPSTPSAAAPTTDKPTPGGK